MTRSSWIIAALFFPTLGCGAGSPSDNPVAPPPGINGASDAGAADPDTNAPAAGNPRAVQRGAVMDLSAECRLGFGAMAVGGVRVSWWPAGANATLHDSVLATVLVGELMPACGKLHRLVSAQAGTAVIDLQASAPPAGVSLAPKGLAIPLLGTSTLGQTPMRLVTVRVTVMSIAGAGADLAASLALREAEFPVVDDPPRRITESMADVKAGDTLSVGTSRFSVLSIVPAMKSAGIVGWVEFDARPSNP